LRDDIQLAANSSKRACDIFSLFYWINKVQQAAEELPLRKKLSLLVAVA
jgi:hypothetical protein